MILQTNSIGSRILKARAGPSSETIVVTEFELLGEGGVVPFWLVKPSVGMLLFGRSHHKSNEEKDTSKERFAKSSFLICSFSVRVLTIP